MACTVADVAAMDAGQMGAAVSDYTPATPSSIKVALPKDWAALAEKAAAELAAAERGVLEREAEDGGPRAASERRFGGGPSNGSSGRFAMRSRS